MRGEVVLLTRNVRIVAEDIESWGGQIVTSDTQEIYDDEIITRRGTTVIDNVEIFNCSQIDTFKAALRFESAASLHSSVTNSAIHNGYAWGLNIKASANIHLENNVFLNFRPIGVGVQLSRNITLIGNIVGGIVHRTTLETGDMVLDKEAAYSICAYSEPDSACTDITVKNNLAAGSVYSGFVMIGNECGDTSGRFSGNVAHSIKGPSSGQGLYVKEHSSNSECLEFSDFKAYKCYYQGVIAYPSTRRVVLRDLTSVDNREGFGANIDNGGNEYDLDNVEIVIKNSKAYGEYGSPDCPQNGQGGFCFRTPKYGMMSSSGTRGGKPFHITMPSSLPPAKVGAIATWGTKVELRNNHFIGFNPTTQEGARQRLFELQGSASDHIPIHEFYDTTFENVDPDALAFFFEPPKGWANIADCGEFPCTAPKNTLYSFKRTTFIGKQPLYAASDWQIIPNTLDFSQFVPGCQILPVMNVWACKTGKLG